MISVIVQGGEVICQQIVTAILMDLHILVQWVFHMGLMSFLQRCGMLDFGKTIFSDFIHVLLAVQFINELYKTSCSPNWYLKW